MSLTELPPDMLREIIYSLPVQDVFSLCESSRQMAWICDGEDIWRNFLQRDYPQIQAPSGADLRQVYIDLFRKAREEFALNVKSAKDDGIFWLVASPNISLAIRVYAALVNLGIYDKWLIFWPDYAVAGSPEKIVDVLNKAHINTVQVGELYRITGGALGDPPALLPLSKEVVYRNSLDLRDPAQAPYAEIVQNALHEEAKRRL